MWKPSKLELILGALIILLAGSVIYHWYVQPIYQVTESEKKESKERLQKHREIEKSPNYRSGYASDTVVLNLEQALEKNPYNTEARIQLLDVYANRTGHISNERGKIEQRIIEGMELDLPPEEKQKFMDEARSYRGMMSKEAQMNAFGTTDPQEIMQKIADLNPTSDDALKNRFKLLENKVRGNENDALSYLEETRDVLASKYGSREAIPTGTKNKLAYHEATVYGKNNEYEKAADLYLDLFEDGYAPGGNRQKLLDKTLSTLEKLDRWKDIEYVIETRYDYVEKFKNPESWKHSDHKLWPKTTQGQLWMKTKKKLGKDLSEYGYE